MRVFFSALQLDSPADVSTIFTRYGHALEAAHVSVKTDNPTRWWTVTDASTGAVYPVANVSHVALVVMDARLVTRFEGAKLAHANFSPNNNQPTSLRGAIFSPAPPRTRSTSAVVILARSTPST